MVAVALEEPEGHWARLRPPPHHRGRGRLSLHLRGHPRGLEEVLEASPVELMALHQWLPLETDPASVWPSPCSGHHSPHSSQRTPSSEASSMKETISTLAFTSKAHAPPTWRARCRVSKPKHRGIAFPLGSFVLGCQEL